MAERVALFDKLEMDLPKGFSLMDESEQGHYFGGGTFPLAYCDREAQAVLGVKLGPRELAEGEVPGRISEYQQSYQRMAPGFAMGEMRLKEDGLKTGVLSFKSNAPTRDLLNMVAVASVDGEELFVMLACGMEDGIAFMRKFVYMVEGMRLTERA